LRHVSANWVLTESSSMTTRTRRAWWAPAPGSVLRRCVSPMTTGTSRLRYSSMLGLVMSCSMTTTGIPWSADAGGRSSPRTYWIYGPSPRRTIRVTVSRTASTQPPDHQARRCDGSRRDVAQHLGGRVVGHRVSRRIRPEPVGAAGVRAADLPAVRRQPVRDRPGGGADAGGLGERRGTQTEPQLSNSGPNRRGRPPPPGPMIGSSSPGACRTRYGSQATGFGEDDGDQGADRVAADLAPGRSPAGAGSVDLR
jgi:hypothetical protein